MPHEHREHPTFIRRLIALTLSCRFFIRGEPPNKNAAKSLSLRERDFGSGSLLPQGEGLGMRAISKSGMLPEHQYLILGI